LESKVRAGIFIGIVVLLTIALSLTLYLENRGQPDTLALRIGVGEGMAGLMMGDVAIAAEEAGLSIELNLFVDCCGNAAQWAINSGALDVGFFCPGIAGVLTSLNRELEIYATAVLNSEVMAVRAGVDAPAVVAVPFQRYYLNDLIHENFPSVTEITQAAQDALLFALSGGRAESAILDITQAMRAPEYVFMPLSAEDFISYTLVVHKDIIDTPQFAGFIEAYNLVADDYNDPAYLASRFGVSEALLSVISLKFVYM
jgi:hypothetical protein